MPDRGEIKKTANKLEKEIAKDLGARRVPGSGMLTGWKGDIESEDYLLDSKNTEKKIIQLKAEDLSKITKEARNAGRIGHLVLTFLPDKHYAVVPYMDCDFDSFCDHLTVQRTKSVSLSMLTSMEKRATKAEKIPSILVFFDKISFGTPKEWLIIPFQVYKEQFFPEEE